VSRRLPDVHASTSASVAIINLVVPETVEPFLYSERGHDIVELFVLVHSVFLEARTH